MNLNEDVCPIKNGTFSILKKIKSFLDDDKPLVQRSGAS